MAGMSDVARGAGIKIGVVEDVFNEVLRILCRGEPVRIKGFGVFERRTYPGRTLYTPVIPGHQATFPDSYRLKFRQSQIAKHRLNVKPKKGKKQLTIKGKKVAKKRPAKVPAIKGKTAHAKAAKVRKAKRARKGK